MSANQQHFLETLDSVQKSLGESGVDYRIIGSVGACALLSSYTDENRLALDFDRPGAFTKDQEVPDIDLLLSHSDIHRGRELRQKYLNSKYSVRIGVATGLADIDFRPGEHDSFLSHGSVMRTFPTALFETKKGEIDGVEVETLSIDALIHTFVVNGGILRKKDMPMLRKLIHVSSLDLQAHLNQFGVFHDFMSAREATDPNNRKKGFTVEAVRNNAPKIVVNTGMHYARKLAMTIHKL